MEKFIDYSRASIQFLLGYLLSRKKIWRLVNSSAINGYQSSASELSNEQIQLLSSIENDGFAVTNLDSFNDGNLEQLNKYYNSLKPSSSDIKAFLTYYLGGKYKKEVQKFDSLNPLLEFSLDPQLVNIVNAYFGMLSRLCYLEMNETSLSSSGDLQMSQNFHRDPGIEKCVKVFIYLNDVDQDSGPFIYVKNTHKKNNLFEAKRYGAGGIYPDKGDFMKHINQKQNNSYLWKGRNCYHCRHNWITLWRKFVIIRRKMATIVYYPPGDLKKSKIKMQYPRIQ